MGNPDKPVRTSPGEPRLAEFLGTEELVAELINRFSKVVIITYTPEPLPREHPLTVYADYNDLGSAMALILQGGLRLQTFIQNGQPPS